VRFFLDHNVDATLAHRLRELGLEAWTASEARMALAPDDSIAVYAAERRAVLISQDRDFSSMRKRTIGQVIRMRCRSPDVVRVFFDHFEHLCFLLRNGQDCFIEVFPESVTYSAGRWPKARDIIN
jgi:predicted nuclease of predicted toxin-antitoxin system